MTEAFEPRVDFASATPDDVALIVAMHEAVERHRRAEVPGARRWKGPTETLLAASLGTCDVVLGRQEGVPVASFRLDPAPGFPGKAPFTEVAVSVYLRDLLVLPRRRRAGIGRRCLDEAERRARARGAAAIRLDTNDDAFQAAAFYAACGYREVLRYAQTRYFERLL